MRIARWVIALSLSAVVRSLPAQESTPLPMVMIEGPLGIPENRAGSGTSWLPDATPMHDTHVRLESWTLMINGAAFPFYDDQQGQRGATQFGITNWGMVAAGHELIGGTLQLRAMMSAEPWTLGAHGYPLLLQTGESYQGAPLHDRQHPHDLFMELAGLYERTVTKGMGLSLYVAPVGEPAVGPVAFPHRPSAESDPLAPIGHHWQDGTHITFGVLTAGVFTRSVKVEATWFNGREPDEDRTDFDYAGRRLDSYGGRVTVNPAPSWSLSAWYAYLRSPEALSPGESLHRFGASVLLSRPLRSHGEWASALIFGANRRVDTGAQTNSVLAESNLNVDGRNTLFGRLEWVQKTGQDLVISFAPPGRSFLVGEGTLGYLRDIGTVSGMSTGVGFRASLNVVPTNLAAVYGSSTPVGISLYFRFRPPGGHTMRGMDTISTP